MMYSEAAYFEGNHCQHVAAWEEAKRLARLRKQGQEAARRQMQQDRRTNARAGLTGRRDGDRAATLATVRPRPLLRSV
jgi:hypothetical protein